MELEAAIFDKEFKECIETLHKVEKNKKKEKYVRCKLYISLPNIVKINSDNRKVAPISTEDGVRYRHRYVADHFQTKYHQACKRSINIPSNAKGSIEMHISKADEKLVSHVTKLLFAIYVDAKKLTSSAYSWPARFVGAEAGRSFDYRDVNAPTINPAMNLQYVNRMSHAELLSVIVESDKPKLLTKLQKSIAASIRTDGSVDRTQIDKIYIMLKIITAEGEKELIFIGISEQNTRVFGHFLKTKFVESVHSGHSQKCGALRIGWSLFGEMFVNQTQSLIKY